jgi:hypothetical protein
MHKYDEPFWQLYLFYGQSLQQFFLSHGKTYLYIYKPEAEFEMMVNCNFLVMELIFHVLSPSK